MAGVPQAKQSACLITELDPTVEVPARELWRWDEGTSQEQKP